MFFFSFFIDMAKYKTSEIIYTRHRDKLARPVFSEREITLQTVDSGVHAESDSLWTWLGSCKVSKSPCAVIYCVLCCLASFHIFPEPYSFEAVLLFDREPWSLL